MVSKPEPEREANMIPDLHLPRNEITFEMLRQEFLMVCKVYSEMGECLKRFTVLFTEYDRQQGEDGG